MLALYVRALQLTHKFRQDLKGVTAMEYGLIAALIALVIIGAITTVGQNLTDVFTTIGTKLSAANTSAGG